MNIPEEVIEKVAEAIDKISVADSWRGSIVYDPEAFATAALTAAIESGWVVERGALVRDLQCISNDAKACANPDITQYDMRVICGYMDTLIERLTKQGE